MYHILFWWCTTFSDKVKNLKYISSIEVYIHTNIGVLIPYTYIIMLTPYCCVLSYTNPSNTNPNRVAAGHILLVTTRRSLPDYITCDRIWETDQFHNKLDYTVQVKF